MSFGGFDRNENGVRVVREELSHFVTQPAFIDKMFARYKSRFTPYLGASPSTQVAVPPVSPLSSPLSQSIASPLLDKLGIGSPPPPPKPVSQAPQPMRPAPPPLPPQGKPSRAVQEPTMRLTPRMIAIHLRKKPFVVVATAIENKHFATVDSVLPDAVIKAIYLAFGAAMPSPSEIALLREQPPKDAP